MTEMKIPMVGITANNTPIQSLEKPVASCGCGGTCGKKKPKQDNWLTRLFGLLNKKAA